MYAILIAILRRLGSILHLRLVRPLVASRHEPARHSQKDKPGEEDPDQRGNLVDVRADRDREDAGDSAPQHVCQ